MGRPPAIPYDEIPNMKFGRLKPINIVSEKGRTKWRCKCDCGKEVVVTQKSLTTGNTKSCGCSRKINAGMRTHGLCNTRLYRVFESIKRRCYDKKSSIYKWYGGKGVTICQEWLEDFAKFYDWAMANGYDENAKRGECTIDRIDSDKGYSPDNCRFITIKEQQRVKKGNKRYEYNGEIHILSEWAEILGLDYNLLRSRIRERGWTFEEAISEKKYAKKKLKKKIITYNGETHSIREWSEKLGIKENTIRSRMTRYSNPEDILSKTLHRKNVG